MQALQADDHVAGSYASLESILEREQSTLAKMVTRHKQKEGSAGELLASLGRLSCIRKGHVLQAAIATALAASGQYRVWNSLHLVGPPNADAEDKEKRGERVELDIVAIDQRGVLNLIEVVTNLSTLTPAGSIASIAELLWPKSGSPFGSMSKDCPLIAGGRSLRARRSERRHDESKSQRYVFASSLRSSVST